MENLVMKSGVNNLSSEGVQNKANGVASGSLARRCGTVALGAILALGLTLSVLVLTQHAGFLSHTLNHCSHNVSSLAVTALGSGVLMMTAYHAAHVFLDRLLDRKGSKPQDSSVRPHLVSSAEQLVQNTRKLQAKLNKYYDAAYEVAYKN